MFIPGPSKVMMHVELTTISNRACAERLGMAIHPDQMCAMAFNNKASCKVGTFLTSKLWNGFANDYYTHGRGVARW